jgi:hypothetical protein
VNQQMTNRSPSVGQLFRELLWPFQTLSWRPVQARDGTTELAFSLQLRSEGRQIAVRWLILSGCFLVAAGVASTVLLMLGGVSAVFAGVLFFVDWQTQTADENKDERHEHSDASDALPLDPKDAVERKGRSMADIHRLPRGRRERQQ